MIDLANMIAMMLADGPVSPWFAPIKITLLVVIVLLSLFMVLIVLLQPGNSSGLGAISGGAETFFGKTKGKSIDKKLSKLTTAIAIVFVLLVLILYVVQDKPNRDLEQGAIDDAVNDSETTTE